MKRRLCIVALCIATGSLAVVPALSCFQLWESAAGLEDVAAKCLGLPQYWRLAVELPREGDDSPPPELY